MKDLNNPLAILVLLLIAVSFSTPFAPAPLITFARDFLPVVSTLVAAYAGALYGASLTQKASLNELQSRQISAGARALFTLWQQLNSIALFQEDIVEKYRNYSAAPLAMPPIISAIDNGARLDIDSLAFLLDHGKSEILCNLCIAETRYLNAVDLIQRRSELHLNEVQPKIESKIPSDRNLSPDELREAIGIRLFSLLVSQTKQVIAKTDDAVFTLETVGKDLHTALKEIFPEGKFPLAAKLEEASSSSSLSVERSTGLL